MQKNKRLFTKALLLLFALLPFSIVLAHPDFVKDLRFKELQVNIPEAEKEALSEDITYYALSSAKFPITFLTISIRGGEAYTANTHLEIPALLADTLKFGGSTKMPEAKLLSKLESLGAKLKISAGLSYISLSVSFLTRDQKEVMNLIRELILQPAFTDKAFAKAKRDIIEDIKRRNDRTESIAFRKAKELVFRKTKTVKEASIESVKQIRKEQIVNYWNSIIQNNPKVIRVVGKFAAKELKQDIRSIFTFAEKSGETYQKEIISQAEISKSFAEVKDKVFLVDRKVNQSMVLMVGTLPQHNHPDFYALQLLNYILGGGGFNSYMMQQIRVERGLAYSATSFPLFKANYGVFYAYSMTKNKSLIEVYNLMQKILSKSTFAKITEKELQKAKGAINNKFVFLFSDKMKIVSNQLRFDEDKMPKDYLKNYRKKMQKVTLEDLRRVGEKYFVQKKLKTILVAPKSVLKGKFPEKYKVISPDYQFPQN